VTARDRLRDERGLVGRAVVTLMVAVLVAGLAVVETASIVFTYISLSGAADDAAAAAAGNYESSRNQIEACNAGAEALEQRDADARFLKRRCRINRDGTVTVTVRKKASTLLVQRIGFLDQLGVVSQTTRAGPPQL
jgi:hypothetical protein